MPSVKIEKKTSLPGKDAFTRISKLLDNDKELRKMDPKYKCTFDEAKLTGKAEGGQFKASMQVHNEGNGSRVEMVIDLPFHLALFKGLVEKTLQKKLEETLS